MVIGVPAEIKKEEHRVSLTPEGAAELAGLGHTVLVEKNAGLGSGFSDELYRASGARIADRESIWNTADLIVKVKEPLPEEYGFLRKGQLLFTYLHLAANPGLAKALLASGVSAFAYETLEEGGRLPLLAPMSVIAGRMAPLMGAYYLQESKGGSGVFAAGAAGVPPANCLILGAGTAGTNAARVASAVGMDTTVINITAGRLRAIDEMFLGRVKTLALTRSGLVEALKQADVVIGAVLVPGAKAPVLIDREALRVMKKGSVIVDISVDQGGTAETSRPTTHDAPVYEVDGIIHYCVANMPGAYPRTSTLALTNSTLPYIKLLAGVEKGFLFLDDLLKKSAPLRSALNVYKGRVVHPAAALSLGFEPAAIEYLSTAKEKNKK
ncbi:MAG: alanine dehydrogenase [Nitrospiraceae bacterium]|nr:alanine dehydrogenase [Nitrospiraceae bacterium]